MTAKLTAAERKIRDRMASGLEELPLWLEDQLDTYARCYYAYSKLAPKLRRATDTAELYKIGGTASVLLKQCDSAFSKIERERIRQQERRAKAEAAELQQRGVGGLRAYDEA